MIASAISAYFYLRVVATMYFQENQKTADAPVEKVPTGLLNVGIVVMVVGVFVLGLFSGRIIDLANDWTNGWVHVASALQSR